jgi:Asp-tRNA(Asn)/Glu-tRNA(Gln) amidotransferase A subunit family amidase
MATSAPLNRRDFCKLGLAATAAASIPAPSAAADRAQELAYLPAAEQIRRFRARQLSPVEVLQAQIARIEAVNGKVNAITFKHFDEALAAARDSEQRYRTGKARPLEGVTVALKDEHGKAGWTVTQGSKLFKDSKVAVNDPVVDKLLSAGAVPHIQTTVPELYIIGVTWSDLWGVTRNPWNLRYAVGGSSGGSGAALASGMTTLATGSDMGGSIRIPCAFNGLYGFKGPYGRVPVEEASTYLLQAVNGPLARTLTDTVLMENVIAGPSPYSPSTIRPTVELPTNFPGIKGWRIAYDMDQSWAEIDPDVVKNTQAALKVLQSQGAIVEEVDLKLGMTQAELKLVFMKALLAGVLGPDLVSLVEAKDQLTTYARYYVEVAAAQVNPRNAREASDAIHKIYRQLQDTVFLKGYQALIVPTLATSRVPADFDNTKTKLQINGREVDPDVGWFLTPLFNLCNWNPVVAVPTGLASNHVPTGMQVVARTFDDATAFQVAAAYARAAPQLYTGDRFPDFRDAE